jgi:hypothetical protein
MATAGVPLWSTTPANNATADPAVNWAEGMAPSAVNDSARAMMASVAKWRNDLSGVATGGSSTAYTVATGATFASASDMSGMVFSIIPHVTSGASPTLSVDGLTARAINDSTGVAVTTGAVIAGTPYLVKYVHASTEFILLGRSSVFTTLKATSAIIAAPGTTAGRPSAIQGGFRFNTDTGLPEFSDGANWLSLITTLGGAQMPYGAVVNGTIAESHTGNAVTFALKTLAGNDPSASDPVLLAFRNPTLATGNYIYRTVTAALSLALSSGSKIGAVDGVAFKVWLVLFDDGGTIKLGAINCVSGSSVYALGQAPIASSTADDNLGGSDLAQVFYTKNGITAVSSKAYVILGYAAYESGLSTAGNWSVSPTSIQLYGTGVPLPGSCVQSVYNSTTTTTVSSGGATIQTSLTASITPTSKCNLIKVQAFGSITGAISSGVSYSVQLSRGTSPTLIGNVSGLLGGGGNGGSGTANVAIDKPQTTSLQAYYVYLSQSTTGGQITFLNQGAGIMQLEEIAA